MYSSRRIERALYCLLCFFLVLYAPYWIYLPALGLGVVIFSRFYEAVAFSAAIDYYYGAHAYAGTPLAYPLAIAAACLLAIMPSLRERMRFTI